MVIGLILSLILNEASSLYGVFFKLNKNSSPTIRIRQIHVPHRPDAEALMWQVLRAKRFMRLKFRRQYVIIILILWMVNRIKL